MAKCACAASEIRIIQIDERSIERDSTVCAEEICGELEEKLAGAVETARYDDVKYMIGLAFHEARKRRAFASEYYPVSYTHLDVYKRQIWD